MSSLFLQASHYNIICHYPECGKALELLGCLSPKSYGKLCVFMHSLNQSTDIGEHMLCGEPLS